MVVVVVVVVVEVEVVFGPVSVSSFVDRVAALGTDLGDMTKDMASKVEFGGLTKVTLRSKVIPLDLKKAVRLEISYRGLHLVG